jgi:uncharacterized protein YjbI with pentapeptide repeats
MEHAGSHGHEDEHRHGSAREVYIVEQTRPTREDILRIIEETRGAKILRLVRADLAGCDLSGLQLDWADLSFTDLTKTLLQGASFEHGKLIKAKMAGVDCSFRELEGGEKQIVPANFAHADLQDADFAGAVLYGVNFYSARLEYAKLMGADLRRANLSGANLQGANLTGARLSAASLTKAKLYLAILNGANLSAYDFAGNKVLGEDGRPLPSADLAEANMSMVKVEKANLVRVNYRQAQVLGTRLHEAYTRMSELRRSKLDLLIDRIEATWKSFRT